MSYFFYARELATRINYGNSVRPSVRPLRPGTVS